MDILQEKMQQETKKEKKKVDIRMRSSFVKEVLEFAMPLKFKILVFEPRYGKIDPREYLEAYAMMM